MRPRTLLILLILVAGLSAFIWFYERDLPSSDDRTEKAKLVFRLDSDEVSGLEIDWEENRVILARESAGTNEDEDSDTGSSDRVGWRLVEPLAARADESQTERLVDALVSLEKKRTLDNVALTDVGLEEPRASVTLRTVSGSHRLLVGSEIPASSTMIVGVEGRDAYYVVDDGVWSQLSREPGEWRSRDLFPGRSGDIERITLGSGDRRTLFAKRGEDFWLEAPVVDRADEDKISVLLSTITSLRAETFIDQPELSMEEMGLASPENALEVVLQGRPQPFRLELGAIAAEDDEQRTARLGDQIVQIQNGLEEALARPVEEWRSRDWSSLETYQIDRVTVRATEGEMTLERAGADWNRGDERIPFTKASDLLYAITSAEAESLVSLDEAQVRGADWEHPTLEIKLEGDEENEKQVLTLAVLEGGEALAQSDDRDAVLVLTSDDVEELHSKLADVRNAEGQTKGDNEVESLETNSEAEAEPSES